MGAETRRGGSVFSEHLSLRRGAGRADWPALIRLKRLALNLRHSLKGTSIFDCFRDHGAAGAA